MPTITDEGKHEKANISTTTSGDVRVALNLLWDSNRLLATQVAAREGMVSTTVRARFSDCREESKGYSMAKSVTGIGTWEMVVV
jgi:hypothetical protein